MSEGGAEQERKKGANSIYVSAFSFSRVLQGVLQAVRAGRRVLRHTPHFLAPCFHGASHITCIGRASSRVHHKKEVKLTRYAYGS